MKKDCSEWIDDINQIYRPLVSLNQKLADAIIENESHPLWAYEDARRKEIGEFIQGLEYQDDADEAGSTRYLPAAIGMPVAVCDMVSAINSLRSRFIKLLKEADKVRTDEKIHMSMYLLDKIQLRRINRKATARQFVVLDSKPQAISFMWNQPVVTSRLSQEEAFESVSNRLLKYKVGSEIRNKLLVEQRMIEVLPADEIVVRVYHPTIQPRVNLIVHNKRMPVKTALLPLFYPANAGDTLPELSPLPRDKATSTRIKRSDTRIQTEPYAPIMRIHRYL